MARLCGEKARKDLARCLLKDTNFMSNSSDKPCRNNTPSHFRCGPPASSTPPFSGECNGGGGGRNPQEKIGVCYYQPWELPQESVFFPIQAGKAISGFDLKIQGDDTGDNISEKNATFSEFTAWYWSWKNIKKLHPDIEYIGLAHYRRFFALNESFTGNILYKECIPEMKNYDALIMKKLENHDIILARQDIFNNNIISQYAEFHYVEDYICIKNIIHKIYPEYDESFFHFFRENKKISLYCMFIARYEVFNKYFEWLFPLLFEAEKTIDVSGYDAYQKRVLAFLAERLLNVYVYHNKLRTVYEPVYFIRKEAAGIKKDAQRQKLKILIKKTIKLLTIPYGIIVLWKHICLSKRGNAEAANQR
jgi:hypothetical protein